MRLFLPFAATAALSACATPSDRISDALMGYGIDRGRAECMGSRLQKNLSISQLQELARVARAFRENDPSPGKLTVNDLLRVAGQVQDPRVPLEVAKGSGKCGLVTRPFMSMLSAVSGR
ncbi:hypothetical protein [Sphingomonas arenae]|uniref:hypothetical protein n=1 Tax=Sphingomonas arenae TaxID=2812555 RepID=UPI0019679936|nr:hypothetical protein [Sphingomonas arenae]